MTLSCSPSNSRSTRPAFVLTFTASLSIVAVIGFALLSSSCVAAAQSAEPAPAPEGVEVAEQAPPEETSTGPSSRPATPKADEPRAKEPIWPEWTPVSDADAVKKAIDRGSNWLIDHQNDDGGYGTPSDVGITGMVLWSLANSHRQYREETGPFISNAVKYLLSHRQESGGIYEKDGGLENYKTSVASLALLSLDRDRTEKKYSEIIDAAFAFVRTLQCAEPRGYDSNEHKPSYGGIGYGGDRKPDMSNTQISLELLQELGVSEDSEEYRRALVFIERSQNTPSNDYFDGREGEASTNDGGFMYAPGSTKAPVVEDENGVKSFSSYGSMTYAGVKSYIYAGLERDDPRVASAIEWIRQNYTVDENPGMSTPVAPARGQSGLFYYFLVMARTFDVLGSPTFETADGVEHRWAEELAGKIISLQSPDGSWTNGNDRWWEGDRALATAYATRALQICKKHFRKE